MGFLTHTTTILFSLGFNKMATINQRELFLELSVAEPILVREATVVLRENYFEPAVIKMQEAFEKHKVTQEIEGGVEERNISKTLRGGDATENLYSFIGFDQGDQPTQIIRESLDENSPNGPKMKYIRGSQIKNLSFQFKITEPNLKAIYEDTPIPWAIGLSWAKRIEQGIPGFKNFLAKEGYGRSEGGIQVKGKVSRAEFKPVKYLSKIIEVFRSKLPS
jgi:hypothetical protein